MRLMLWVLLLLPLQAAAAERVALVIGNSAYAEAGALPNAGRDASAIAAALLAQGFAVTELHDLGVREMEAALAAFRVAADAADIALVYYAGHGIEADGQNYLIPVDALLADARDVARQTIPLEHVLLQLSGAARLRMIVLDACRNNPFTGAGAAGRGIGAGSGLAAISGGADNMLVAYAAAAGAVTPDGPPGGNSPFTAAFLDALAGPPRDVRLLLGDVRDGLRRRTRPDASPAIYGSLGGAELVLNPGGAGAQPEPPPPPPPAPPPFVVGMVAAPGSRALGACEAEPEAAGRLRACAEMIAAGALADAELALAFRARALAHAELGAFAEAVADLDEALRRAPDDADARAIRGWARAELGDFAGAEADLAASLAARPEAAGVWSTLGWVRSERGDWEGALAALDTALARGATDAGTLVNRGWVRGETGDFAGAIADLTVATRLSAEDAGAWSTLGWVTAETGDFAGALPALDAALRLDPTDSGTWSTRGWVRSELGDFAGAVADLTESLLRDPTDAGTWANRGWAHSELGELVKAAEDLDEASRLAPDDPGPWNTLGWVRRAAGDAAGALAAWEREIALGGAASVQAWQEHLADPGNGARYAGPADGVYGAATRAALASCAADPDC